MLCCPAWAAGAEPPGLHVLELARHKNVPTSPDLIGSEGEVVALDGPSVSATPCKTIFGYLPYWSSSSNIRYDHLTHLACFSLELNTSGNGTFSNLHSWPWTSLVNTAHSHGVKVILTVTLFNDTAIKTLTSTPSYKNAFFANLKAQMLAGNADGVNIDFESNGVDYSWQSSIHLFMADLTAYLHAQIPGCEVSFAGPAVNWSGWNLTGLAASCDYIFIMGYAFWGSWSSTSGPNAPLTGGSNNITNTVTVQYAAVTQNSPQKLILGLPYYGNHWLTSGSGARSSVVTDGFVGSLLYQNEQSATYGRLWDATSQTPWYRWNDGTNWHQVWYDDAESLGLKYDLAVAHNLRGVGMWALGYDGARSELWTALATHIGINCNPAATFSGQVPDADTGQGLPSAPVTWGAYTRTTDSTGHYTFTNVNCGSNALAVSRSGYTSTSDVYTPTCADTSVMNVSLAVEPPPPGTDRLGFWRFSEGTGQAVLDSAAYGFDGELHNATWVAGEIGGGLHLPGTNAAYIEVADRAVLNPARRVIIEASIKPESYPTQYMAILYKGDTLPTGCLGERSYSLWATSDGGLYFAFTPEGDTCQQACVTASGLIATGQWSRVKADLDARAGRVRLYVNAAQVLDTPCPAKALRLGGSALRIGGMFKTAADQSNFKGDIDEIRLYGEARGDFDHNGQIAAADLGHLQACMLGAQQPQSDPNCTNADLDADGDVDQDDFGVFQRCLTPFFTLADRACAW
jgi:spore germination protein YaaH